MRRPIIAGNWKMNLHRAEALALAESLVKQASHLSHVELVVCPPSVYLEVVASALRGSHIGLGAQNMYPEANGAFTGELSASMLCDIGCRYVIVGHSERRQILGETDSFINKKVHAALAAGLTPIVCVGELLAEREAGETTAVVRRQTAGALAGVTAEQVARIVLAYEPVWAIGTGRVASKEQAQEVHAELRKFLAGLYNDPLAQQVRIQYGGSVKPSNATELLAEPDVDGALVGGASLKVGDFLGIVAGLKVE